MRAGVFEGAYTDSVGMEFLRRDIAAYITERDGLPCDFLDIFLSAGASDGIKVVPSARGPASLSVNLPRFQHEQNNCNLSILPYSYLKILQGLRLKPKI